MRKQHFFLVILVSLLMLVVSFQGDVSASTITNSGGSASSYVTVSIEPYDAGGSTARRFSVIVPITLPVEVLSDGSVVAANNVEITNNSSESVKITNISMESSNGWTLVDYNTNLSDYRTNEHAFAFMINDGVVSSSGTVELSQGNWPHISSKESLSVNYMAKFPKFTTEINSSQIAEVIFTVAFVN